VKWLKIFKSVAAAPTIEDPQVVESSYKYWRLRIFIGMYVGYVFYYFSRKSYTCVMPLLIQDLGMTKSELGILASLFAIAYGGSKFLSGVLSDRANPRIFMSVGLMLTGLLNILFGMTSSLSLLALFWGLNGLFQGWGWPPCAKLLTSWYSQKERGTWWGFWNSSHNVGGAIIPLVVGISAQLLGWRFGMYVPGILCICMGLFVLLTLRDTPASLGLPPIEKFKNDYPAHSQVKDEEISLKDLIFKYILNNRYIWLLGIAYFFVYLIRGAFNDWSPLFLMETRGYQLVAANAAILWFEMGGLVGSLVAGWASDKIFKGRRGPINTLFSLAVIGAIVALWKMPPGMIYLDYLLIFIIGFLIFGPQMLIGVAAAELSHKKAAGAATGFIGFIAYLGIATSGYPLTKIMEAAGWSGFFITLGICGVVSVLLLIPMWGIKSNPRFIEEEKKVPAAELIES
jgi:OPA family sugar phosphate sensor protein UhpC-like MFS transporter